MSSGVSVNPAAQNTLYVGSRNVAATNTKIEGILVTTIIWNL